jgi:hypothetical protein
MFDADRALSMSYDLAIYRVGALSELAGASDRAVRHDLPYEQLEAAFASLQDRVFKHPRYRTALTEIEKAAKEEYHGAHFADLTEKLGRTTPLSLPTPSDTEADEEFDRSSHLVGLLPSERLNVKIGQFDWIVRIRASFTACSLEFSQALTKLWWTFEGVPADPDPDRRPSERDAAELLKFVHGLEEPALDGLNKAYFGALGEVAKAQKLKYHLGPERIRVRFADNNDVRYSALIDAIRFRGLKPVQIKRAEPETSLALAKEGLLDFGKFVKHTNLPPEPRINPNDSYVDIETWVPGVSAVEARRDFDESVSIVGVAQRPGAVTPYDHLDTVREQRLAENREDRLRASSAARRWTARRVALEAMKLERRRRKNVVSAPAA